jgi:hypothetical protein
MLSELRSQNLQNLGETKQAQNLENEISHSRVNLEKKDNLISELSEKLQKLESSKKQNQSDMR